MSEQPPEGVLGSLPRTRPHRRSAKRGPAAANTTPEAAGATEASAPPAKVSAPPAKAAKPATATKAAKPAAASKGAAKKPPARKPTTAPGSTPPRSLQSATAPRAAGARSRKPGATSQMRGGDTAGPQPLPKRTAPPAPEPAGALGTAVQAAAELTEIGLKAGARALRGALTRLPHR